MLIERLKLLPRKRQLLLGSFSAAVAIGAFWFVYSVFAADKAQTDPAWVMAALLGLLATTHVVALFRK